MTIYSVIPSEAEPKSDSLKRFRALEVPAAPNKVKFDYSGKNGPSGDRQVSPRRERSEGIYLSRSALENA